MLAQPHDRRRRLIWRYAIPAALAAAWMAAATHRRTAAEIGLALAVPVLVWLRWWWRTRRFRRTYTRPVLGSLRPALGDAPVRLRVDPSLGSLLTRLARPMSPAETQLRGWYGRRVEPVMRWVPDRVWRGLVAIRRAAAPVTSRLVAWLRPAKTDAGPRIELEAAVPYLTDEQRNFVSAVISAKLPAGELVEHWDLVGERVTATWTVRRRPPGRVGYPDLVARFDGLAEDEFLLGLGVGAKPVTVSLADDSPHIACSAGSGAGKSVLAQLVAVQVLARGGRVVILDVKGSHRWALGMPAVEYCTRPEQMHEALLGLAAVADRRNQEALHQPEGWDPGQRVLVLAEEMNASLGRLRDYWNEAREPGQPKTSPAIVALKTILFMGRSAKVNVFAVAQMLTSNAIGGPDARENMSIRCLSRYSSNAWRMLCPSTRMPRPSRTLGRWQIVVAGEATECQVAYLSAPEARLFVAKHAGVPAAPDDTLDGSNQGFSQGRDVGRETVDPMADLIALREATERGAVPWNYETARKRLRKARGAGAGPEPVRRDGSTDLYRLGDLIAWAEKELVS